MLHASHRYRAWLAGRRAPGALARAGARSGAVIHRSSRRAPASRLALHAREAGLEVAPMHAPLRSSIPSRCSACGDVSAKRASTSFMPIRATPSAWARSRRSARREARRVATRRFSAATERRHALEVRPRRARSSRSRRAVGRVLSRSGIGPSASRVVPDGMDTASRHPPASAETLASLGCGRERRSSCRWRSSCGHKDPLNFVRAIAAARDRVPALQALLVGDGPLRAEVADAVHALGLEGTSTRRLPPGRRCASRRGRRRRAQLARRGNGLRAARRLFLGKPVAATAPAAFPRSSSTASTGLLAPVSDSRALGDAIARCSRIARSHAAGAAARARADDFSVERMTDRDDGRLRARARWRAARRSRRDDRRTDAATRASSVFVDAARRSGRRHFRAERMKRVEIALGHAGCRRAARTPRGRRRARSASSAALAARREQHVLDVQIVMPRAGGGERAISDAAAASAAPPLGRRRRR